MDLRRFVLVRTRCCAGAPYLGKLDVGAGIQAGTGAALRETDITFSDPNMNVAASSEFAERMEFSGRSESDLASWSLATERLIGLFVMKRGAVGC